MHKKFAYNPATPCLVLRDGREIGALVAGVLYCFETDRHHTETFVVVEDVIFEYGKQIGHFEGRKIVMEHSNDVFEIIEA
ncbi:hypothetical protein [Pseudomonas bubulae]|uniref:hypothetical protein n=1 Tax=Pseudomonas bubulae TaxID=2316085 RepID=UPI001F20EB15|nr:hypothetical protein [Pseudomonas bubulae]MCF3195201.1 hypothetical protein [Pseudomonas bubulae]